MSQALRFGDMAELAAKLRAEVKLEREWRERAEAERNAAHERIGYLESVLKTISVWAAGGIHRGDFQHIEDKATQALGLTPAARNES